MAKFKFPDPNKRSVADPTILMPAERVLALYNQETGSDAKRVSPKVQAWTKEAGHEAGFDGVVFTEDATPGQGRGCILWKNFSQPMPNMVVLVDQARTNSAPLEVVDAKVIELPPLPKIGHSGS